MAIGLGTWDEVSFILVHAMNDTLRNFASGYLGTMPVPLGYKLLPYTERISTGLIADKSTLATSCTLRSWDDDSSIYVQDYMSLVRFSRMRIPPSFE